jgi:hypothetical protein
MISLLDASVRKAKHDDVNVRNPITMPSFTLLFSKKDRRTSGRISRKQKAIVRKTLSACRTADSEYIITAELLALLF